MFATLCLCVAIALAASISQTKLYEATGLVLLKRQDVANQLTGTTDSAALFDPERDAETQAQLAMSPPVLRRVTATPGAGAAAADYSVVAQTDTDLLAFAARASTPNGAVAFVNEHMRAFSEYRRALDTGALVRARQGAERRIEQLSSGTVGNREALVADLNEKVEQLRTLEALQTSNAVVVRRAAGAGQVQPRTTRNVILGFLVGIAFALALALALDTLDTRIRSAEDIERFLHMPLLGRIPRARRRARTAERVLALTNPQDANLEPYRFVRTNLELASAAEPVGSLVITSAVRAEGKSTTLANVAVLLARSGTDVILVDLDLRRPTVARLFGLEQRPGLAQVLLGHASLDEALAPIDLTPGPDEPERFASAGSLRVLPAGAAVPNVGELISSPRLSRLLDEVLQRRGMVLIDAPPVLGIGDAMTISARTDAILVVTRLGVVRKPMLRELGRVLDASPARALGYVVTGADEEENYTYGYGYGYGYGAHNGRGEDRTAGKRLVGSQQEL